MTATSNPLLTLAFFCTHAWVSVAILVMPRQAHAEQSGARTGEHPQASKRGAAAPTRPPVNDASAERAREELGLQNGVTREALVRLALRRSPAIAAAGARARAMRAQGDAEARISAPMAEVQIWQIPLKEPYRLDRAGMTMIGLRQEFMPGRSARARAARVEASVEESTGAQGAWMLTREIEHAFVDYVEASEVVAMHTHHEAAAERVEAFARARYVAGGALQDIAQAERESAMIAAELAAARRQIEAARARINGLLVRPSEASLGPPIADARDQTRAEVRELLRRAERARPELEVARRKRDAARAMAEAERTMKEVPTVGVGAYYFPPSDTMPNHAFGVSFTSTLPWLWGDVRARSRAAEIREEAAAKEHAAARAQVALEVMTTAAGVAVAASELEVLEERVLPASRRAEEATLAGYEAGRADILSFLMARTAVRATEVSIVRARAALAHALADLRWAAGGTPAEALFATEGTNDVR
jgi:outer membrane protein TolC